MGWRLRRGGGATGSYPDFLAMGVSELVDERGFDPRAKKCVLGL